MIGRFGSKLALLAFAGALLAGIAVGNAPATVLTRALTVMIVALFVGQLVGWTSRLVMRDHLQNRKAELERAHLEASQTPAPTESAPTAGPEPVR